MANELLIPYPTGATLYALLFDSTGQVWNGSAFAAPGSANWTDYDIAMTEAATATGIYRASMPAAAAGVYGWTVRKQAGGSPAIGDITVGSGRIEWSGTAEVTLTTGVALTAAYDAAKTAATQTSVNDLPTNAELATALAGADDAVLAILGTPAGASISADVAAIPTVGEIDTQLSSTHGDGSWEGIGTGATAQVYTVYLADGVTPVSGVVVRMTTDAAGLVLIDQQISDASGEVSLNHDLASGTTVYLWRYKVGLSYSDPDIEVIP